MLAYLTPLFALGLLVSAAGGATGRLKLDSPASAEVCGRCHRAIHEAWKRSAHSRAMESRLFQDALEAAETAGGAAGRRLCMACHAPVAVATGDLALQAKVSWEGVTCDYCHSLREVAFSGAVAKARVEFGPVKSGTLRDTPQSAHPTLYSEVHTSSATCAPCHDYRNAQGFPVLTTYSEWKDSPAAKEGKNCQSCHMYLVKGDVVEPRAAREGGSVNLHEAPGSHSVEQLNKAVRAVLFADRDGDRLRVRIEVTNRTAGHSIPTGSPLRQLVLEVQASSFDGKQHRAERRYARTLTDQRDAPLDNEYLAFTTAARVLSDTRLAAGEQRAETFVFPVPRGVRAQVGAKLWYYYSPTARKESERRIPFLTLSRLVQ